MLNNEVSIHVDICRTILIDGWYKRCYADVGTDNMEVKETRKNKELQEIHIELRCAAVHIFLPL